MRKMIGFEMVVEIIPHDYELILVNEGWKNQARFIVNVFVINHALDGEHKVLLADFITTFFVKK